MILVEYRHHFLWLARFSESRESTQVAEDDNDLAPVTVENRLITSAQYQVGNLWRKEAP